MNQKLWNRFINGEKIAIIFDKEEESFKLMKLLYSNKNIDRNNVIIDADKRIGITLYNDYKIGVSILGCHIYNINDIRIEGFKIVTFQELMEDDNMKKVYEGWELAKALKEDKIKENVKFKDKNENIYIVKLVGFKDTLKYNLCLYQYADRLYSCPLKNLIYNTFTLIEESKKYYTFDEARKISRDTGKKIKLKDWHYFYHPYEALQVIITALGMTSNTTEITQEAFNEKSWEIEKE